MKLKMKEKVRNTKVKKLRASTMMNKSITMNIMRSKEKMKYLRWGARGQNSLKGVTLN